MKELQNVWNLSAAMDFNKDRYKTANKNGNRLTFVFERQQIHDGNKKKNECHMCLNGVTCRETPGKKKSKNCNMLIDHFLS